MVARDEAVVDGSMDLSKRKLVAFPPLPTKIDKSSVGINPSGLAASEEKPKLWSQVASAPNSVLFDYIPPENGQPLVNPPDEVLKLGNDNLKLCILGIFAKGSLPFHKVSMVAAKSWGKRGLVSTSQKSHNSFIFRFADLASKNAILSKGTWLFYNKPVMVSDLLSQQRTGTDKITTMPIWVKFTNIPDSYWTRDGMSSLASVVGRPICADKLTEKLNIRPYARFCVEFKLGDKILDKIQATVLDPWTGGKSVVDVDIEYQTVPKVCDFCDSLGHLSSVCPVKPKVVVKPCNVADPTPVVHTSVTGPSAIFPIETDEHKIAASVIQDKSVHHSEVTPVKVNSLVEVEGEDSPTPLKSFANLHKVDKVVTNSGSCPVIKNARLNKSERRKAKRAHAAGSSRGKAPKYH